MDVRNAFLHVKTWINITKIVLSKQICQNVKSITCGRTYFKWFIDEFCILLAGFGSFLDYCGKVSVSYLVKSFTSSAKTH